MNKISPRKDTIVFRCNANMTIGTGHVMRCLCLAQELLKADYEIVFILDDSSSFFKEKIEKLGFSVVLIANEFDGLKALSLIKPHILIVDSYDLDKAYHVKARAFSSYIMVIDDLANRPLDCDILLDQNFFLKGEMRYKPHINPETHALLGPHYALLRPEFSATRSCIGVRDTLKTVLVFFGGGDHVGMTKKTVDFLSQQNLPYKIIVVVGALNPERESIKEICNAKGWTYYQDVSNMAEIIAACDIAIGAGGMSTLERACLGLPTVVITIADNQIEPSEHAHEAGFIRYVGHYDSFDYNNLIEALSFFSHSAHLQAASQKGLDLTSADGSAKISSQLNRLVERDFGSYIRQVNKNDAQQIWDWRNSDDVRLFMNNQDIIPWDKHLLWIDKICANPDHYDYSIFYHNNQPAGVVGFYNFDSDQRSCEWGLYIGNRSQSSGKGQIMAILGLNHIFRHRKGVDVVYAEVIQSNNVSVEFHKKLGFQKRSDYDLDDSKIYLELPKIKWNRALKQ